MFEIVFFIGIFYCINYKCDGFWDKLNLEVSKCKWYVGFIGIKLILESG